MTKLTHWHELVIFVVRIRIRHTNHTLLYIKEEYFSKKTKIINEKTHHIEKK